MSRQTKNTKSQSSHCSSLFALWLFFVPRTATFTWLFRCCVFYTPTYLCMEHSTYTTRAPQFATLAVPTDRSTRSAFCGLLDIVWRASNLSVELSCLMFANSQGNKFWRKRSQCSSETDNGHEHGLQDAESAKFPQGRGLELYSSL